MVTDPARLTKLWAWTRSLNTLVQGVIWLLFLPWMICLWMWTLPLAMPIRFVLVIGARRTSRERPVSQRRIGCWELRHQ